MKLIEFLFVKVRFNKIVFYKRNYKIKLIELTTLWLETYVDDQNLLDSQLILLGCSLNRRDSNSSENLKIEIGYLFWRFIHKTSNVVGWFSDYRVEHWKVDFGALAFIPRSAWWIFTPVGAFDDFWLFLSIWCNRWRKKSLEFVLGMFWNVGCQSVSRTLLWCSSHLQEIVKAPEIIVILIIILHFY